MNMTVNQQPRVCSIRQLDAQRVCVMWTVLAAVAKPTRVDADVGIFLGASRQLNSDWRSAPS